MHCAGEALCHAKSYLQASWAHPSDLSRILLPPAPISAVTRVYAISLGRLGIDPSETCLMGIGFDGRARLRPVLRQRILRSLARLALVLS